MIKEQNIKDGAAIASARAAEIYDMKILAREIEDTPNNFTRFFILSKKDSPPTGMDKTSIVFSVKHKPGALYDAIKEFADSKINLTKIESRPTRQKAWEYNFYLDFEGHHEDKMVKDTLDRLDEPFVIPESPRFLSQGNVIKKSVRFLMKVAIIGGSGKMGQWFARYLLKEGMQVVITGRNRKKLLAAGKQLGVPIATNIEAVKQADVVIISVPLDNFETVVKGIAPHTRQEQIIFDVTSLKTNPVEIMHRYIKKGTILGTHPVFGPGAKSASQSELRADTDK